MKEQNKEPILYVFGGEKASGAEIVIERLMAFNGNGREAHLFIAPGGFASKIKSGRKPYTVVVEEGLKKLNRSSTGAAAFYFTAVKNYVLLSYKVAAYLRRHNINLVHANTVVPASYLIPVILLSKVFWPRRRWLWSDHDLQYYSKVDTVLSKLCVAVYDKTLVVSNAVKRKYEQQNRVSVLYNGIDLTSFAPDPVLRQSFRVKRNIADGEIILGMAASIGPRKGQLALLKTFETLSAAYSNITLILAGAFADDTPEYTGEVSALIRANRKVIYLGHVDDMVAFYNGCDVIINNSNATGSEPLGTTIYEGMACEKIVVASATGGTPEIITDKDDGYLFEAGNTESLKACLQKIFTDYEALGALRKSAREKAANCFDIRLMARSYNEIVESLQAV